MTYKALTIAKWFAAWAEAEDADLSNLKLQKLLYYAQGWHLGMYGRPLFDDKIQAWSHGPVVPAVYHAFKSFEAADVRLDPSDAFDWDDVNEDTTDFLIDIWERYGGFGAWKLRNMTHNEAPWRDHFDPSERHTVISNGDMQRFFARRVKTHAQ